MTLLTPVTLLLAMTFTSALLTALALMAQTSIKTGSQRLVEAKLLAQNQINTIKAKLAVASDWQKELSGAEQQWVTGALTTQINGSEIQLFNLQSVAFKEGTTAKVTESVIRFPLLANIPPAALMYQGELEAELTFTLVVPQTRNRAGYSVWSDEAVSFSNAGRISCLHTSWQQGNCPTQPLSRAGHVDTDVAASSANFPADLLAYLFNVKDTSPATLANLTGQHYANCAKLPEILSGIVWIHEDCDLQVEKQIGSEREPVLLIITNGQIRMAERAQIVGLVLHLCQDSAFSYSVEMAEAARIDGALVSNCRFTSSSHLHINYHRAALAALQRLPTMQRLHTIPGSWRDF